MKAERLFEIYAHAVGQAVYAPVVEFVPVKKGEKVIINAGGLNYEQIIPCDGWLGDGNVNQRFLTQEEFAAKVKKIDPASLNIAKKDIPADADPEPVKKGHHYYEERLFGMGSGNGVPIWADREGYVLMLEGQITFMSDLLFRTVFNTNAPPQDPDQAFYRVMPSADAAPVCYVVLPEPATIDFQQGPVDVPKGTVVYESPEDEDGYTATPYECFEYNFIVPEAAA